MVHGVNKERKDYGMSYSCLITAGRKEGGSKNLMNIEDKRVNTRRNESGISVGDEPFDKCVRDGPDFVSHPQIIRTILR